MKVKLKQKEVIAITWDENNSQDEVIKQLEELGCYDINTVHSGAGISIDFKYLSKDKYKPLYYGAIFKGMIFIFEDNKHPEIYGKKDFENIYETIVETTFLERLILEEEELGKKIVGLANGLNSDGFANKVGMYQFELLSLQHSTMISYRRVLRMRIEDLKTK